MPSYTPQEDKSPSTIRCQPKDYGRMIIHHILERDIAGWKRRQISQDLDITESRISIIVNSPMYRAMRDEKLRLLHDKVAEKMSTKIADAETTLKEAKAEAATTLVDLMRNGKSDAVRASVAEHIVDRGKDTKGGINVVVQINEKMSERLDKVLRYSEGGPSL